jgi:hypothetical protein
MPQYQAKSWLRDMPRVQLSALERFHVRTLPYTMQRTETLLIVRRMIQQRFLYNIGPPVASLMDAIRKTLVA